MPESRRSLLSSYARIQAPWIKVTIGDYTFGVFSKSSVKSKDSDGFYYTKYNIQYPNYIQNLTIEKINGQINKYTLGISYPVRPIDDPNFFEKVFSSVSSTRKIVFSYGDASMPSYIYKDEEAIITQVQQSFGFGSGGSSSAVINYTVQAVSGAALGTTGCFTFLAPGKKVKPSKLIHDIFFNRTYGLQSLFTGVNKSNFYKLVDADDKEVELTSKINVSPLDYITYLVGCMIPASSTQENINKSIYILTIHDDTTYDRLYTDDIPTEGPYFKISKTSYAKDQSDAYEVDIGYNTATIVTNFQVQNNENYSIYYDYQSELYPEQYVKRLNNNGQWEDEFAPTVTSRNDHFITRPEDITWWTKLTKYPIKASITIQGLLRPAILMTYLRLNVVFPGGHKHISSGLYLITKQTDSINGQGYRTTLELTKINGDNDLT